MAVRRVRIRAQDDFLDQPAQDLCRFRPGAGVVQRVTQVRNLARVNVRQTGMDHHRRWFRNIPQTRFKVRLVRLQRIHLRLHAAMVHAVRDCRDEAVDILANLRQPAFDIDARGQSVDAVLLHLPLKFRDELGHQLRRHQTMLQTTQYAAFNLAALDRLAVVAGAPVPGCRAAIAAVADHDVACATAAAFEKAGEEVARPAAGLRLRRSVGVVAGGHDHFPDRSLPQLHPMPERVIDDPKLRHLLDDPGFGWIGPGLTLARRRVLDEPLAVPHQAAQVQFVVQDAGAALPVAGNGGEGPGSGALAFAVAWRGMPLAVQFDGDRPCALALVVVCEDAAHQGGLAFVDDAIARAERTVGQGVAIGTIAEADPSGGLPGLHPAFEATVGLLGELLQEQGRHGAAEADVQLVDLALGLGDNLDPEIAHALVQASDMLLVTAEAIQCLSDDHIDLALHRGLLKALEVGPQMRCSAQGFISKNFNDRPAVVGAQAAAQPDLIGN